MCLPSCNNTTCCCVDSCSVFSLGSVAMGHAFDLILVQSDQDPSLTNCSDVNYSFDPLLGVPNCCIGDIGDADIFLEVENCDIRFPIENNKIKYPASYGQEESGYGGHDAKALKKLTECCSHGEEATRARVVVVAQSNRILAMAPCYIHFWSSSDRIFVCDIDGTITKSNLRGLLDTVVTQQYSYCHDGVCQFLQSLVAKQDELSPAYEPTPTIPNIRILYLSSRPLGLAFSTRKFLQQLRQEQPISQRVTSSLGLPRGPLIGFTGSLRQILVMELMTHSVHEFKARALQRVVNLWNSVDSSSPRARGEKKINPFWAGLGNTYMDAQAYHEAGMDLQQIYIIDKNSEIRCLDRNTATEGMPMDRDDYRASQRTLFPFGYQDKNIIRHILSAKQPDIVSAYI
uniref:LNS2/PITP domain-containing protein n=1 Tax=Entomoneis paludosa TaxID=265537 RepID=A0A7S2YU14_9STRA